MEQILSSNTITLFVMLLFLASTHGQNALGCFINTVPVGNPGNAAKEVVSHDTRFFKSGSFGAVSEKYRIGTTEVTNDQYVTMLNAVAASDPRSLFDISMQSDPRGGIVRSGSNGNYTYSSKPLMGNKPVNYVSFWDTKRFANWLNNGMPSGSEDLTTTEDGAYFLGGITNPALADRDIPRKPDAKWFLPTEDEWFKAAYHKNDGITGNYFDYPTATDEEPTVATADQFGNVSNPGSNVVNYSNGAHWNGLYGNVTTVGSATSASAYGTLDQAGNLDEFVDTLISCSIEGCNAGPGTETEFRLAPVVRGGTYAQPNDFHIVGIHNGSRDIAAADNGNVIIGFRVATILPGPVDFNNDGSVDGADLALWQSSYSGPLYDVNNDGLVNDEDYQIWQANYLTEIPYDDNPANLNGQGPVDDEDLMILQQSYGVDAGGDIDGDGDTDGEDFLLWQRAYTPYNIADANHDRLVDEADLELWTQSNGYTGLYDADCDGDSDGHDFLIWQRELTQSAPAPATAVPEPGSLLLGLIGFFACLRCRVRLKVQGES